MTEAIFTRIGIILDGNNRYLGHATYDDWHARMVTSGDAVLAALGVTRLDATAREVARLATLCLLSPDARVWPLKLTRLVASYGDPLAGVAAGQLVTAGRIMGPNAAQYTAQCLADVGERVRDDDDDATVRRAVDAWKERVPGGRLGGFGVPFRDEDERRVALLRYTEGTPITAGRYWRLHERVVRAMAPLKPNIVISLAAMVLDIGIAPDRAGAALSAFMAPVFLAHALESSERDGARLHSLPADVVEYRGAPHRASRR